MPKIVDHEEVRTGILERALGLFARDGYAALTMRALASELEVSTGTLYHYFPTKQAIFAGMLAHLATRDVREALAAVRTVPAGRARIEALFAFVDANEAYFRDVVRVGLDAQRQEDPELAASIAATLATYRETIRRELEIHDPDDAGWLIATALGAVTARALDPAAPSAYDVGVRVARALAPGG